MSSSSSDPSPPNQANSPLPSPASDPVPAPPSSSPSKLDSLKKGASSIGASLSGLVSDKKAKEKEKDDSDRVSANRERFEKDVERSGRSKGESRSSREAGSPGRSRSPSFGALAGAGAHASWRAGKGGGGAGSTGGVLQTPTDGAGVSNEVASLYATYRPKKPNKPSPGAKGKDASSPKRGLLSPAVGSMKSAVGDAAETIDTKRRMSMAAAGSAAKRVASIAQKQRDNKAKKAEEAKAAKEAESKKADEYKTMINKYKLRSTSVSHTEDEQAEMVSKLEQVGALASLKSKMIFHPEGNRIRSWEVLIMVLVVWQAV